MGDVSIRLKLFYKPDYMDYHSVCGYGYIQHDNKVIINYDCIGLSNDVFDTYNDLIDCLPDNAYVVFDYDNLIHF